MPPASKPQGEENTTSVKAVVISGPFEKNTAHASESINNHIYPPGISETLSLQFLVSRHVRILNRNFTQWEKVE